MVESAVADRRRGRECLQLVTDMGDHVGMIKKSRLLVSAVVLALAATACGGGESDEDRAALMEMLARLSKGPNLAECMVEEFDGEYTAEDLEVIVNARGNLTTVDFSLVEAMVVAERNCTETDDG